MEHEWQDSPSQEIKYSHYEIQDLSGRQTTRKPPKRKHAINRVLSIVLSAALFGCVSGIVFVGTSYVGTRKLVSELTELKESDTTEKVQNSLTESVYQAEAAKEIPEESVMLNDIIAESGTVAGVAQTAMPSVVAITSVSIQEIPIFYGYGGYRQYSSTGSGSGIIVGENEEELLIATNNHVISGAQTLSVCFIGNDVEDAEEETIHMASGGGDINVEHAVTAKIKGTDEENDLAVIAVVKSDIPEDTMKQIKIAQLGNSDDLIIGEQVVAIGNALGYGQSVTSGWISAMNRNGGSSNNRELIQTDAAINPGNSGGALLNMRGELIGINSSKYADEAVEGMGYAIPISKAKPILEELMNRKTREVVTGEDAAYMGIQAAELSAEAIQMYDMPAGAFLIEIAAGGPADLAGLCKGDIIVQFDGQKVSGKKDLYNKLQYYSAGETIEVVFERAVNGYYQEMTRSVTMGKR